MDLTQNPFYILSANPRDNRQRILELADEKSLTLDSALCNDARSVLTTPRKRLSAETGWLVSLGPKRVEEMVALIESSPESVLELDKMTSLTRTNLLVAAVSRVNDLNAIDLAKWLLEISWAFEEIDIEEVQRLLNEERIVSGFPEITDITAIEAEIKSRRLYFREVLKSVLDKVESQELVKALTIATESTTDVGEKQCPVLLADLVDAFEIEAQEFFEIEEEKIKSLVQRLHAAFDSEESDEQLAPKVDQLIEVVKNWDIIAQPIQVVAKSRGHNHDTSHRMANIVRELAVHIFNEHGKLEFSQKITKMIQEVFAEVVEVAERTAEDFSALENIAEQIREAPKRAEEWKRANTYEAEIGLVFKDKLMISPEVIEWKNKAWKVEDITRCRWGGTRHAVNGIPTGTTYTIVFGNDSKTEYIQLKKEAIYSNFIERFWRIVGVQILTNILKGLREGHRYNFAGTILTDHGMELHRAKFFKKEQVFCPWDEIRIWNGAGEFCVGSSQDKKISNAFSYQDHDNIHILEAAIRTFFDKGGRTISSILDD